MGKQECGCEWERCEKHAAMMSAIYEAWGGPRSEAIWAESDGYGEPGFIPTQGYDWSGIRDSTVEAVERMYAVVTR